MSYTDEEYERGKTDYEAFRERSPVKLDGTERPVWDDISDYDKLSWITYAPFNGQR